MQNKSKSWTDVQMLISSISIAVTLGFWGLLAARNKVGASVAGQAMMPAQPDPVSSNPPTLLPGQTLYFSGTAPQLQQPQPAQQPPQPVTTRRSRSGGGGGGGGGGAHTGSS